VSVGQCALSGYCMYCDLTCLSQQVVGFDCVDDESKPERRPTKSMPQPVDWNTKHNAAYSYYVYYLYANLYTLNKFRCAVHSLLFAARSIEFHFTCDHLLP
jgi:adenosine deaminase